VVTDPGIKNPGVFYCITVGNVYQLRGDLARAETMYGKALALAEPLGYKSSMVDAYVNLGLVYWNRGDLARAEAMYRQALSLYQDIGATSLIEQVRASLNRLRVQGSP
jgi:tetratricopeptide (TPR) repeat protein